MSESSDHRTLVEALAREITGDSVWTNQPIIYSDILNGVGTSNLPPIIGSHRPDVFALDIRDSFSIVGEVKTAGDIDNMHTFSQLESFFNYLRVQARAEFWMGVPWMSAGTTMRVCRYARKISNAQHVPVRVVAFMVGNTDVRRVWRE